ncbi:hypothetical protein NOCARDAX2BIS_250029 [Nocardioides sp. AX2bis]|nr:hypothetical protein NOCARDAX2BIS_250029 [Nocardioides sp. AX2bis]
MDPPQLVVGVIANCRRSTRGVTVADPVPDRSLRRSGRRVPDPAPLLWPEGRLAGRGRHGLRALGRLRP